MTRRPSPYTRSVPEPIPAVIVAAGMGVRFGGPVPKPVTTLAGKAVVAMSVEAMAAGGCTHAIVMVPRGAEHHFGPALAAAPVPIRLVNGGDTRQASVHLGLQEIARDPELRSATVVLVHDGVRPLVPATVVERVIEAVHGGAVAVAPAIAVVDSIREEAEDGTFRPVDRDRLRAVQTPQGFNLEVLLASHDLAAAKGQVVTDDVSACELAGHPVTLVKGAMSALKITSVADLHIAQAFLKLRKGLGHHRLRRVLRHIPPRWIDRLRPTPLPLAHEDL